MKIRKLVLDANVLLLLVVGRAGPGIITRHKRLRGFADEDYDLLVRQTEKASRMVTTPNVFTEVSNLHDQGFNLPLKSRLRESLRQVIGEAVEQYRPSRDVAGDPSMKALGLTDTSLLLCLERDSVLLTIDSGLFREAIARGQGAVNFHHLREDEGLV